MEFADFDAVEAFVVKLCSMSSRPVVAFSGTTASFAGPGENATPPPDALENGVLSTEAVAALSGLLGRDLARRGFRVTSGHGEGVGIPAVAQAFLADPSSARFLLRPRGHTRVSREAPAFYVRDDRDPPESWPAPAGAGRVRPGPDGIGGPGRPEGSGTALEVRQALDSGKPVLLLPQAGGSAFHLSKSLEGMVTRSIQHAPLREAILRWNKRIADLRAESLQGTVSAIVCDAAQELVDIQICDAKSRIFDESLERAARIWAY